MIPVPIYQVRFWEAVIPLHQRRQLSFREPVAPTSSVSSVSASGNQWLKKHRFFSGFLVCDLRFCSLFAQSTLELRLHVGCSWIDRRWLIWFFKVWIGGGFDGFEDGVGSRLFPTMVEDLLYHLLRDVRSRYLVFRCVFRWMPFRMSAAACMSEKSGGDPILRHVPSSEVFDKMKRPCDLSTCPHHKTRVVRYGAYGFEVLGCGPLYLVKVAFCIRLYVFCFVFGFGPLDLVHLIKSRWKKKKR